MKIPSKDNMAKAEKLSKSMVKDLNDIVDMYFNHFDDDNFEAANLHWKQHCYRVNRRQKLVKVDVNAFEKEVARVVSQNPQFQKESINFSKL